MKRFLTRGGVIFLCVSTAAAALLCVAAATDSGTDPVHSAFGGIIAPLRAGSAAAGRWVESFAARFAAVEELQARNEALEQKVAELEESLRQAQTDSEENRRLRELLGLRRRRRDFSLEAAFVTARSGSNWASALTLDKGTACGVAIGNCVMDSRGALAGVVTEAGETWCTVTTVLDPSSELGAKVFRTGETGIASGNLRLMTENRLSLHFLEGGALKSGDLVITSGLGGYYPAGLLIGSVEELRTDDGGVEQYAVLIPRADIDGATELFIITAFSVEK